MSVLESEWFAPRLFAGLAVAAIVGAVIYWGVGHPWGAAGLLAAALCFRNMSCWMVGTVRARHDREREYRRKYPA